MKLAEARALRDEIREDGLHCTVPTGYAPDRYFAQIWGSTGRTEFNSRAEWLMYRNKRRQERNELHERIDKAGGIDHLMRVARGEVPARDTRSPLDRMIDKACGLD